MENPVDAAADQLLELDPLIMELTQELLKDGLLMHDFFVTAVLNRTLQLLHGTHLLIKNRQFLCAAPLLRLQIDNALRLYASSLVASSADFTSRVMDGERIDRMKTMEGEKMTDKFLVESLSKVFEASYLPAVYEHTSGYVHLSGSHIFRSVSSSGEGESKGFLFRITRSDEHVSEELWLELIGAFKAVTIIVLRLVGGWSEHKHSNLLKRPTDPDSPRAT